MRRHARNDLAAMPAVDAEIAVEREPLHLGQLRHLLIEQAEAIGEPPEDPLLLFSVLFGFWVTNYVAFHGDVMRDVLDHYARHGVKLRDHRMEKGSIWVFDTGRGGVEKARYLPPPKST